MTRTLHLWPEEHQRRDGQIEVSAALEGAGPERTRLYFRLPLEDSPSLTQAADPFVLATAFRALRVGADLQVHGAVSPSLLCGLEEFQVAWCRWRPDRYQRFTVHADSEVEGERAASGGAVTTFSGGLDSCCTVWRHTIGDLARRKRALEAAVMVHGFDIPVDQDEVFAGAVARARPILDSAGIRLVPVVSNVRALDDDWEDSHGAALAASLHLVAGGYSTGLIAGSHTYEALRLPWGSNPLTDPMLGSASFSIVPDGCELTRWDKAAAIADWDEATRNLRVCWEGERLDRNCGHCMRCVGTAFCFAAVGRPIPPSLVVASPEGAIEHLRALKPSPIQLRHFENMVRTAQSRGISDSWVDDLSQLVCRRGGERGAGVWAAIRRRLRRRS